MQKTKLLILVILAAVTIFNLVVTTPYILDACTCYRSDGKPKCTGDCCGGKTRCDCYDKGTDNCKAIVPVV